MPVYKKKDCRSERISDNCRRKVFHLDKLMLTVCDFTGGPAAEPDPPHSHTNEQITYVDDGDLFFYIGNEKHFLTKGDICTIPSGFPHCIQILSSHVRLIDAFSPIRKDFLK